MTELSTLTKFIEDMTSTRSRNEKETILARYKGEGEDSVTVQKFLKFMFDPRITTSISSKKWDWEPEFERETRFTVIVIRTLDELYSFLDKYCSGRYVDLLAIRAYVKKNPEYDALIKGIVTKNIQLGVEAKTINKVFGKGFVFSFEVQLAQKYYDKPEKILGKEGSITEKIDGERIIAVVADGEVKLYKREGQLYEGIVDLEAELLSCDFINFVFDGELTLEESTGKSSTDFTKLTSIEHTEGEKHGLKMRVFDVLTLSEFKNQKCEMTYERRQALLATMFKKDTFKYFERVVPMFTGIITEEVVDKYFNYAMDKDMEGIMINRNDATYQFKRTWDIVKVKPTDDLDLKIVGFLEGTNKYEGMLGALNVEYVYEENGQMVRNIIGVGSGLTDIMRKEIWDNQDKYLGLTAVVKYTNISVNKDTGLKSIRFPRLKCIRDDKIIVC